MSKDLNVPFIEPNTPISGLSQVIKSPDTGFVVQKSHKFTIMVYYWVGDTAYMQQLDLSPHHRVYEVINMALHHFRRQHELPCEPNHFLLRFASKDGSPKTHYPKLEVSRSVVATNYRRFCLLEKSRDERIKSWGCGTEMHTEAPETEGVSKKRSLFCCCFSSD